MREERGGDLGIIGVIGLVDQSRSQAEGPGCLGDSWPAPSVARSLDLETAHRRMVTHSISTTIENI